MRGPFVFEPSDAVHARALARLAVERVGWLTTHGRDGYPHAVPVWFVWRDGRALILSEPATAKVRNIAADDRVALHLESGHDTEQITVLRGVATLAHGAAPGLVPAISDDYTAKYAGGLAHLGWTLEQMAARYSTVIEVTPHKALLSP